MQSINLFTPVLFVLVGFCAGVAFNFVPINTAAQGVSEAPPAALKSVAHDATLAGDGTKTAPLGIANGGVRTAQLANGAVTASKLSPAAIPTAGQVMGFNGANLAWQNSAVGGVRVVDSLGQVVGPFIPPRAMLREINGLTFVISVSKNGFESDVLQFWHTTSDCSGPRYMESSTFLFRPSDHTSTKLFYAADPPLQFAISSLERIYPPADPSQQGQCERFDPFIHLVGLVASLDLSTLGLVPPFRLEF